MTLLKLLLVFLLQNGGIRGKVAKYHLYQRPGDEVLLPSQVSVSETRCSDFHWLYNRDYSGTSIDVRDGKVKTDSPRAERLSLSGNCSLVIKNITAEDAGLYTCRYGDEDKWDTQVYLNILTISQVPTDKDPNEDGEVTLECSLFNYKRSCIDSGVRWVNEAGAELNAEGDGFRYGGQTNCVSFLTLKLQTEPSRRYSCQHVEETDVKIEAQYTTVSKVQAADDHFIFIIGGVVGLLLLLLLIVVILLKCRKQTKSTKDVPKPASSVEEAEVAYATVNKQRTNANNNDETESTLTYATVSHAHQKVQPKEKVKVEENLEEVTYSTVRTH